jgi:hypothetical protein
VSCPGVQMTTTEIARNAARLESTPEVCPARFR